MQIVWEKSRLEIEKGFRGRVNIRKGLAGSSGLSIKIMAAQERGAVDFMP